MPFRVSGLNPAPFTHLYGLTVEELRRHGALRVVAEAKPGCPDRVELRDLDPGESAILLNHAHQPADTPYRSSHAIFVREGATVAATFVDEVPEVLRVRPLSLRAFDAAHLMVDADLVDGADAEVLIERLLAKMQVAYVHAHYARRGCYAALIERA